MSLKIRLAKTKNDKAFRVVVAEVRSKRNGKTIDSLGNVVFSKPPLITIDAEKYKKWLSLGAQPTKSLKKILK